LSIADKEGRTAWMYAAMSSHTDIAEIFREMRGPRVPDPEPLDAMFAVESAVLKADQPIPREYTADGHNWSPPLTWSNAPPATKSFAVVLQDPDAGNPPPFVHWVIYNIPSSAKGVPENVPFEPGAAMPAEIAGAVQGLSGFRRPIYRGPAPPPGKPHHYHFDVYALDVSDLKPNLTRAELLDAIKGHVLAQAELVPVYERKP
jgi:Raf kinase inhibitor-like YbhB/YbcL family protein